MLLLLKRAMSTRVRRTLFNVPGSDERKLSKAKTLTSDTIVFDLEDGVPLASKTVARGMVVSSLADPSLPPRAERAVRINGVGSRLEDADLKAILPSQHLQAIVIPKVEHAAHVKHVASLVDALSPVPGDVMLIACIESALGLLNIREIAAAEPRLDALVFASEDFCADLGLIRTQHRREMLYARSTLVTAAVAHGLQAIDLVCIDYKNNEVLKEECKEGREMGFTGKQAIHPGQIGLIQELFSSSAAELATADNIIKGFEASGGKPFNYQGKVVDTPVVKWAHKIKARAF